MKKKVTMGFAGNPESYVTFDVKEVKPLRKKKRSTKTSFGLNLESLSLNATNTAIKLGLIPDYGYAQVVINPRRFRKECSYFSR